MGFTLSIYRCVTFLPKLCWPRTGQPLCGNMQVMIFLSPSWHLYMTLYLATMNCLWRDSRQNGLGTPTLYFTPSTLVTYMSERERENTAVQCRAGPQNSHRQNTACDMWANLQSRPKSCTVSKHLPDHPKPLPLHSQALAILPSFLYSLKFKSMDLSPLSLLIPCMQAIIIYLVIIIVFIHHYYIPDTPVVITTFWDKTML